LLLEGKSTGSEQSDDLTHYSELNDTRMNRLDKMIITDENIQPKEFKRRIYLVSYLGGMVWRCCATLADYKTKWLILAK
jgi:hypothetical protein